MLLHAYKRQQNVRFFFDLTIRQNLAGEEVLRSRDYYLYRVVESLVYEVRIVFTTLFTVTMRSNEADELFLESGHAIVRLRERRRKETHHPDSIGRHESCRGAVPEGIRKGHDMLVMHRYSKSHRLRCRQIFTHIRIEENLKT